MIISANVRRSPPDLVHGGMDEIRNPVIKAISSHHRRGLLRYYLEIGFSPLLGNRGDMMGIGEEETGEHHTLQVVLEVSTRQLDFRWMGRGGGIRRSTPLLRRTRSVVAATRRRELADAPGEEVVAGREGRRRGVAGHCPTPSDPLASSELSSTASLGLYGCQSSVLFCSVLASDLPISLFLFLPNTQTPSQNPNLSTCTPLQCASTQPHQ
nr:hypothetical protein Itr_chr12CG24070 [Ipomoea trifida]